MTNRKYAPPPDAHYAERFADSYIPEPNSGCWLWLEATTTRGYGFCQFRGRNHRAHRMFYILHKGEIPDGLWVLHKCDNPTCVNPDHLYLGTHADNTQDQHNRDRFAKGERAGLTKLTATAVLAIRASKETSYRLAKTYGVDPRTLDQARRGETWSWLT